MPDGTSRLVFVTGKGGVGKSTVAAALALARAAEGKKVLVCEINPPRERLGTLLEAPPPGEEVRPVAAGVDGVVIRPGPAMREYVLMQIHSRALYSAVFENRLVSRFLRFIPSLSELVMLGKVAFHAREGRWDQVIVDAPATGHGVSFLRVPRAVHETIPPGPMRRDAEWMQAMLEDPAFTEVDLVSLPEELPVNETVELAQATRSILHMQVGSVLLNRFVAPRFSAAERGSLDGAGGDEALARTAAAARAWSMRADMSARHRERLARELGLPVGTLPQLALPGRFGRQAVEQLARELGAA